MDFAGFSSGRCGTACAADGLPGGGSWEGRGFGFGFCFGFADALSATSSTSASSLPSARFHSFISTTIGSVFSSVRVEPSGSVKRAVPASAAIVTRVPSAWSMIRLPFGCFSNREPSGRCSIVFPSACTWRSVPSAILWIIVPSGWICCTLPSANCRIVVPSGFCCSIIPEVYVTTCVPSPYVFSDAIGPKSMQPAADGTRRFSRGKFLSYFFRRRNST